MSKSLKIILLTIIYSIILLGFSAGCDPSGRVSSDKTNLVLEEGFHDQAWIYMDPIEPSFEDSVTLRVRVPSNSIDKAEIVYSFSDNKAVNVEMLKDMHSENGYYEYWVGAIPAQSKPYRYRFIVENKTGTYTILPSGVTDSPPVTNGLDFYVMPGFKTPDWSKGAVWYSIMPVSFFNGDPTNDTRTDSGLTSAPWGHKLVGKSGWPGGDLYGIEDKAEEYLNSFLGVDSVFINPIWESTHNAGYGAFDLGMVNAALGTEQSLAALGDKLHESDMRIMLDGVFRYFNWNGYLLNRSRYYPDIGAYQSKESKYFDWFNFLNWPDEAETDWAHPILNFSSEGVCDYIYRSDNSIMQKYLREPYSLDGWRMDVGDTLSGTNRGEHDILKDMRTYVKQANPEAIFLSENASENDLFDYTLDSKWNYVFGTSLRQWAMGAGNQSSFSQAVFDGINRLPRGVALSSYNFLTTHDLSRFFHEIGYDHKIMKSAQVVQMTYLGAPCIYYGEEIGLEGEPTMGSSAAAPNSFSCFDWDKSHWDLKVLNTYRSLLDLRNKYPDTMRTGAYRTLAVDNKAKVLAYARFDGDARIITLTNQGNEDIRISVSVRVIDSAKGHVFVDWFTGKEYEVDKNGNITIDISKDNGGTVLVWSKEKQEMSFIENKEIMAIGEPGINDLKFEDGKYVIDGNGNIGETKDDLIFIGEESYGNFAFTAALDAGLKGKSFFGIRGSEKQDSSFYGVEIDRFKNMSIVYRKTGGSLSERKKIGKYSSGKYLTISRSNNTFYVSISEEKPEENRSPLEGSEIEVEMGYTAYAGMSCLSGQAVYSFIETTDLEDHLHDDFDSDYISSVFESANKDMYRIDSGKLALKDGGFLRTKPMYHDFTAKTKIDPSDANTGLRLESSNNDYIYIERDPEEKVIRFSRDVNGHTELYACTEDIDPNAEVYFQLQKMGNLVGAFYSYDGEEWDQIGQNIYYGLTESRVSLFSMNGESAYDWFTFGDSINAGGCDTVAPVTYGPIDLDFSDVPATKKTGRWISYKGEWETADAGLASISEGDSVLGLSDKTFEEIHAEVTLKLSSGTEYAGFGFGLKSSDNELFESSGYYVLLKSDKALYLYNSTELVYSTESLSELFVDDSLRVSLRCSSGSITLRAGLDSVPVINFDACENGYFALYSSGPAHFGNYKVMRDISSVSGYGGWDQAGDTLTGTGKLAWTNLNGYLFKDFEIDLRVEYAQNEEDEQALAGIAFDCYSGVDPFVKGTIVGFNNNGTYRLIVDGETVESVETGGEIYSSDLRVSYSEGVCKVFIGGDTSPLLEQEIDRTGGGSIQLFCVRGTAHFKDIAIESFEQE